MTKVLGKNVSDVLATYGAQERERDVRPTYDIVKFALPEGRSATMKEIKSGTELTYIDVRDAQGRSAEDVTFRNGLATWHDQYEHRTRDEERAENAPFLRQHIIECDRDHDGTVDWRVTTTFESWKQVRVKTEGDIDGDGRNDNFEETRPLRLVLSVNGKPT